MHMMPRAVPCTIVSMRIVHAGAWSKCQKLCTAGFNSGSPKNNTWLVKTLQYVISTFELFLVLLSLSWLSTVG